MSSHAMDSRFFSPPDRPRVLASPTTVSLHFPSLRGRRVAWTSNVVCPALDNNGSHGEYLLCASSHRMASRAPATPRLRSNQHTAPLTRGA